MVWLKFRNFRPYQQDSICLQRKESYVTWKVLQILESCILTIARNCMLALMPIAQVTAVTGHRGSTSGYAFILPGGVITWSSKKQTCIFLSTAEAEYVSLCTETQVVMLIRRLLTDLGCTDEQPYLLYLWRQSGSHCPIQKPSITRTCQVNRHKISFCAWKSGK